MLWSPPQKAKTYSSGDERAGNPPAESPLMQSGEVCHVIATFIEDRDGRALVRLPNGSKTSVDYGALIAQEARAHFIPAEDGSSVRVLCLDDDWSDDGEDFTDAARLLQRHAETHSR